MVVNMRERQGEVVAWPGVRTAREEFEKKYNPELARRMQNCAPLDKELGELNFPRGADVVMGMVAVVVALRVMPRMPCPTLARCPVQRRRRGFQLRRSRRWNGRSWRHFALVGWLTEFGRSTQHRP
jgi:hypothetical protein